MALFHGFSLPGRVPEARSKVKEAITLFPGLHGQVAAAALYLQPHPSQGLAFGKLLSSFRPLYFTVWRKKMRELVMQ